MTYVPSNTRGTQRALRVARQRLLRLRKFGSRILHRRSGPSKAVFVVGSGRSGTDLIVVHLQQSMDVELYNEDHPAAFEDWRLRPLPEIELLLQRTRAPVSLFKPIVETYRVLDLLNHFEGSRALFVIRNPFSTVKSRLKFFGDHRPRLMEIIDTDFKGELKWPVSDEAIAFMRTHAGPAVSGEDSAALIWYWYNRAWLDLGLGSDPRVMLVDYDRVVQQPAIEFARLCSHMGARYRAAMVRGVRHTASIPTLPGLSEPVRAACVSLWEGLQRSAADQARALGSPEQ